MNLVISRLIAFPLILTVPDISRVVVVLFIYHNSKLPNELRLFFVSYLQN